jgi:hypothetical protein
MPFGHTISPRLYRDRREQMMSQYQLFQAIFKGLCAVGMKPIMAPTWTKYPYEEIDDSRVFGYYSTHGGKVSAYFDFPDTSTFIDDSGNARRPIMCMAIGHIAATNGYSYRVPAYYLVMDLRSRKDGAIVPGGMTQADVWGHVRTMYPAQTNGWWGDAADATANQISDAYMFRGWRSTPGGYTTKFTQADQMLHETVTPTNLHTVRNIEVLLSKGGLHIQAGSGTRKFECSNIINQSWLFFNERIPGMGKAPADDADILRTNPVKMVHWYNAQPRGGGDYDGFFQQSSGAGYQPRAISPGACYTHPIPALVAQYHTSYSCTYDMNSMHARFRSYPVSSKIIWDSPRVVDGIARHMLSPLICFPMFSDNAWGPARLCYRSDAYDPNGITPNWEEYYYNRYVCFSDPVAPYGVLEDPESGKDWWFSWCRETMLAFEVEGLVTVDHTWAPTHSVLSTVDINFVTGAPVASDNTPITVPTKVAPWTFAPGENRVYITSTTQNNILMELDINVSGDPAGTKYEIEFECRYRGAAGTGWPSDTTSGRYLGSNIDIGDRTRFFLATDSPAGTALGHGVIRCAGDGATLPDYDWTTHTIPVAVNEATMHLLLYFNLSYFAGSGSKTFEFRNLKLRRKNLYVA